MLRDPGGIRAMSTGKDVIAAAFFRVEGAIVPCTAAFTAAWLGANSQHVGQRIARVGAVAAALPFLGGEATFAARLTWLGLRGVSEDRLVILGEEFYETWMRNRVRPAAKDLVDRARASGRRVIFVSDNLDVVVRHLADQLGADELLCNRLEMRDHRATGRLLDPVISRLGGRRLRELAEQRGLDLAASSAYGALETDAALLSSIGLPCALHPDRGLRRVARDLDWPVVEG